MSVEANAAKTKGVSADTPLWFQVPGTKVCPRPMTPNSRILLSPMRGSARCSKTHVFDRSEVTPRAKRSLYMEDPLTRRLISSTVDLRPSLRDSPLMDHTRIMLARKTDRRAFNNIHEHALRQDSKAFFRVKGPLQGFMEQVNRNSSLEILAAGASVGRWNMSMRPDTVDYAIAHSRGRPARWKTRQARQSVEARSVGEEIRAHERRTGLSELPANLPKRELIRRLCEDEGFSVPPELFRRGKHVTREEALKHCRKRALLSFYEQRLLDKLGAKEDAYAAVQSGTDVQEEGGDFPEPPSQDSVPERPPVSPVGRAESLGPGDGHKRLVEKRFSFHTRPMSPGVCRLTPGQGRLIEAFFKLPPRSSCADEIPVAHE